MMQLDHINNTNGCFLMETFAGFTIIEISMPIDGIPAFSQYFSDLFNRCAIERSVLRNERPISYRSIRESFHRSVPRFIRDGTPNRIKNDINRRSIFHERHIFCTNDLRNNTFVSVTTAILSPTFNLRFTAR
jgi:hypothetical protein